LRAIVATPPRRSALLLTLFLAFLACVLGFAGARTALAQPTHTQIELTVACDPTQGVTYRGRVYPYALVTVYGYAIQANGHSFEFSHEDSPIISPNSIGVFTGRIIDYEPELFVSLTAVPAIFVPVEEEYPTATGQTTCPPQPEPGPTPQPEPGPTPQPEPGPAPSGEGGGSGSDSGGSVIFPIGDVFSDVVAGQLPDTGGGWAILLIVGAILIALGWLLARLTKRDAGR
jgi:LPXTG-motif cell wall-anchored protein